MRQTGLDSGVRTGPESALRRKVIFAVRAGSSTAPAKVAYEIRKAVLLTPTPIVKDGLVFLWGDTGVVTCIEAASGKVVWRERVGENYCASPVWVDGRLYGTSRTGDVVVIRAGREFELISKVSPGESSFATPAVANGVTYLRTESKLMSIGGHQPGTSGESPATIRRQCVD